MHDIPFHYVAGVQQWEVGELTRRKVPLRSLMEMVSDGRVTPRDLTILEKLMYHRFMTSSQLAELFFNGSLRASSERLSRLVQLRLLHRFRSDPPYLPNVYVLDDSGFTLLQFHRPLSFRQSKWRFDLNVRPLEAILRYLALNQLAVRLRRLPCLKTFGLDPVVPIMENMNLYPGCMFSLERNDRQWLFFAEAPRRDPGWLDLLNKKLTYYGYYLDNRAWEQYGDEPVLIIIAESDEQCLEVQQSIREKCPALTVRYTTDERLTSADDLSLALTIHRDGRLVPVRASVFAP